MPFLASFVSGGDIYNHTLRYFGIFYPWVRQTPAKPDQCKLKDDNKSVTEYNSQYRLTKLEWVRSVWRTDDPGRGWSVVFVVAVVVFVVVLIQTDQVGMGEERLEDRWPSERVNGYFGTSTPDLPVASLSLRTTYLSGWERQQRQRQQQRRQWQQQRRPRTSQGGVKIVFTESVHPLYPLYGQIL